MGEIDLHDEGTKDVEKQDTDVNALDGLGEVLLGVLGLTSGDSDNLGMQKVERVCHW